MAYSTPRRLRARYAARTAGSGFYRSRDPLTTPTVAARRWFRKFRASEFFGDEEDIGSAIASTTSENSRGTLSPLDSPFSHCSFQRGRNA
jgi:hypothetical protein